MSDLLGEQREGRAMVGGPGKRGWLIVLVAGFFALLFAACQQQEAPKATPVALAPVTLCRTTNMHLPLVVAEKQGFFAEQGLALTIREFTLGRDALDAMLKGECDLATSAEPPVAEYSAKGGEFRILCTLQSSDNLVRLVGRADRGIATPLDLRGKRIGTVKGTAPHYFLELFLERHGLTVKDVAIVFMKSDELLGALTSGQVDAFSMTNNVIFQAQEALQGNAVLMEAPGLHRGYFMLLATTALLDKRPGVAEQFLRALAQAEDFIHQRPEETQAIAQAFSPRLSPMEIRQLVGVYQYQLGLDHALLMGLEDTARWTLQQSGNGQHAVPNFLNLIAAEPLRAVRPEAVRLEK